MKTAIYGVVVMVALLLCATHLTAQTVVSTLGGGPLNDPYTYYGDSDGNTLDDAQFHTPCGIAMDISGRYLVLADKGNNEIRIIDLIAGITEHLYVANPALINNPIGVAVDSAGDIFVLNYGNGSNGTVLKFDYLGNPPTTNAVNLANVGGITLDAFDNIYVTVNNNQLIRITSTNTTTIATIPIAGTSLQGLIVKRAGATAGLIAVCDSGRNGIYLINPTNGIVSTNAGFHGIGDFPGGTDSASSSQATFNQPMSLAETSDGSLIVADYGNNRVKVVSASNGEVENLYGVTSNDWVGPLDPPDGIYPGWWDGTVIIPDVSGDVEARQPYGVVLAPDGTVYVTENYYDIIRKVTGSSLVPPPPPPTTPGEPFATVNFGQVSLTWSASSGATSYNVKRSLTTGGPYTVIANVTGTSYTDTNVLNGMTYYYVISAVGAGGESPNSFESGVTLPVLLPPTGLAATTNFNQVNLTWAASSGASSYNVLRSPSTGGPYTTIASNVTVTTYSDTTVVNGTTYYYVVIAVNSGGVSTYSAEISATPPLPPVPAPQIGYVTFPPTNFTSVFVPVSSSGAAFNNDVPIVIEGTAGSQTFYTYANTPNVTNVPNPTSASASAPLGYIDGLNPTTVASLTVAQILPNLSIKAIGEQPGHPNSAIVSALFQFIVANPLVNGTNAAQFVVTNITAGAQMYYTTDGSIPSPTNAAAIGPITNGATLSLSIPNGTNLTFEVAGYKENYQPSTVVTNIFSQSNYVANTISFGFASGEASSEFIASPGQTFVAPVTLTTLPGQKIYSLQFNLVATNAGPNPGPAISPVFGFASMLEQPDPTNTDLYLTIPPAIFNGTVLQTPFEFTSSSENLLGVGWLESADETNLYNTKSQDLITYSQAHDDLFPNVQQPNGVIVGGYSFTVPLNASPGSTYQIQIGLPSATSDGIGAPGSDVFIYAPTNGSFGAGSLNSIKYVTVGSAQYIAGDCAPFRWFNAGDFGDTNLDNADVEQVFHSAIYSLNEPPPGSDFLDSMDSAGGLGADYGGYGYLQPGPPVASEAGLFDGNDTSINFNVFGDGMLDVSDVYVTFRRSLDPSLMLFSRFWTNDTVNGYSGLAAVPFARSNLVVHTSSAKPLDLPGSGPVSITNTPSVNFASTDFVAIAGQMLQIPVTAKVFGAYPLRVAMLNISVVPMDGSPALTVPISFAPNSTNTALGAPTSGFTTSDGINNYATAWLDSTITGISNSAVIGTLTVTIPTNATSLSSYAIHFDHASGSPNGLVSFPRQALTGLITLSSRTNSTYNDGIPDSWRLRWFGTVNNYLSVSNADADGDGFNNWQEYVAGTDPADPKSRLTAGTDQAMAQSPQDSVIYWPSVAGKQYVVQRSASLFPGTWNSISTNTGTGGNMEIHDASSGGTRYYRVRVQ